VANSTQVVGAGVPTGDPERYRLIAENASDVVFLIDADEVYRWASPSVTELFGWQPGEVVGRTLRDFVHPDDVQAVLEARRSSVHALSVLDSLRYHCADGTYRWVSGRTRTLRDADGHVLSRVVALRDEHESILAQQALAASEHRYRLLAENASDVVYQSGPDGVIQWISPSVDQLLGWTHDELVGRRAIELIPAEDLAGAQQYRDRVFAGEVIDGAEVRFRNRSGDVRWMSVRAKPIRDAAGDISSSIVALRDCQAEVVARRAATALSAGNATLTRAVDELELLQEMCRIAVQEGGYLFAWYGRPVEDADRTVAKVATSREHQDYLDAVEISWGDGPLGQGPTGTVLRTGRTIVLEDIATRAEFAPWHGAAAAHGFRSAISLPVYVHGGLDGAFMVYAGEPDAFDATAVNLLEDLAHQLGSGLGRLRDGERLTQARAIQTLLNTAIDQAAEAVIVNEPGGAILYANPAAVRSSGYAIDELLGANPRIIESGLHDGAFYEAIRANLARGIPWHGVLVNRRKTGELYEEDATIAPVRDADGRIIAHVAVKHDLTIERRLEADLTREKDDREAVVALMRQLRPAETLMATTAAFCDAALRLDHVDGALILLRGPRHELVPTAAAGIELAGARLGVPLALADDPALDALAQVGPVGLDLADPGARALVGDALVNELTRLEVTALGVAPLRGDEHGRGALVVATRSGDGAAWVHAHHDLFEELGTLAGTLIAAQAEEHQRTERLRNEIRNTIREGRFHPVYQPVVDLATGAVVGFEALTRFDDGAPPDEWFTLAAAVGLVDELEAACAAAAIQRAAALPADAWLGVNFSPGMIVNGQSAHLLATADRAMVIEITEHAEIASYEAVTDALRACPNCRVSVDDAGAGWASLRHILELKPDMVKLDITLVRDIDRDRAKQALTAGLCYFAEQSGTILVAEGVETDAEAHQLLSLGVHLGQGFLFGRPEAIPAH
jgi:PAS domain S-box-containing protein